jgi:hypothetical protein
MVMPEPLYHLLAANWRLTPHKAGRGGPERERSAGAS